MAAERLRLKALGDTNAPKISNGSTGFIGVTTSGLSRDSVRADAITALRQGSIPRGEM